MKLIAFFLLSISLVSGNVFAECRHSDRFCESTSDSAQSKTKMNAFLIKTTAASATGTLASRYLTHKAFVRYVTRHDAIANFNAMRAPFKRTYLGLLCETAVYTSTGLLILNGLALAAVNDIIDFTDLLQAMLRAVFNSEGDDDNWDDRPSSSDAYFDSLLTID